MFQFSADCSDEVPPDYEMSVGGPPTNPISGASEITVNESSVVLDPAERGIDLPALHPETESTLQAGESRIFASSAYRHFLLIAACDSGGQYKPDSEKVEILCKM